MIFLLSGREVSPPTRRGLKAGAPENALQSSAVGACWKGGFAENLERSAEVASLLHIFSAHIPQVPCNVILRIKYGNRQKFPSELFLFSVKIFYR